MPVRPVIRAGSISILQKCLMYPLNHLNLSVKRNSNRFSNDFMFRLTKEEREGERRYLPYALNQIQIF